MACSSVYATPADFAEWWGYWQHEINIDDQATVDALEHTLKMAAGKVNMALRQVGACDCTLADDAAEWLKEINIIACAVSYRSPSGPRLSDEQRVVWLNWVGEQLKMITEGDIDPCSGSTGKNHIAFGSVEQGHTIFSSRDIIENKQKRDQT